jgi:hypothetical protein
MLTRKVCTLVLVLKVFYINIIITLLLDLTTYIRHN